MASITPGYNHPTYGEVSAATLRTFVEDAYITDVNWSEVDPSIPRFAYVGDTSFSLGPEGSIWFDRVRRELMVQAGHGPVALWAANGMESRRFPYNSTGFGALGAGHLVRMDTSGSVAGGTSDPAIEVATGVNTSNLGEKVFGVTMFDTAVTNGLYMRLRVWGISQVVAPDVNTNDDTGVYGGAASADGQWYKANAETTDKVCGVQLGRLATDAYGVSKTAAIFLQPCIWRA